MQPKTEKQPVEVKPDVREALRKNVSPFSDPDFAKEANRRSQESKAAKRRQREELI